MSCHQPQSSQAQNVMFHFKIRTLCHCVNHKVSLYDYPQTHLTRQGQRERGGSKTTFKSMNHRKLWCLNAFRFDKFLTIGTFHSHVMQFALSGYGTCPDNGSCGFESYCM